MGDIDRESSVWRSYNRQTQFKGEYSHKKANTHIRKYHVRQLIMTVISGPRTWGINCNNCMPNRCRSGGLNYGCLQRLDSTSCLANHSIGGTFKYWKQSLEIPGFPTIHLTLAKPVYVYTTQYRSVNLQPLSFQKCTRRDGPSSCGQSASRQTGSIVDSYVVVLTSDHLFPPTLLPAPLCTMLSKLKLSSSMYIYYALDQWNGTF